MPCTETRHERDHEIGRRLIADDTGATAIEYGLLTALIALAIIGAVASLGDRVMTNLFQTTSSTLSSAIESAS